LHRLIHSRLLLAVILITASAAAQTSTNAEQRTSRYFWSIHQQPLLLLAFLREMPKGGDLHDHLGGAIYAEDLIKFAVHDGLCVDRTTFFLVAAPCDAACDKSVAKPAISCGYGDSDLYNSIIDAWSMRNWERGYESGHDHFFATFGKFDIATSQHTTDTLAEAAHQAALDHLQFLELMHTADHGQAAQLGAKLGWNDDFGEMRDRLLASGLKDVVVSTRRQLDEDEAGARKALACGTAAADPGCDVTVRYLYQVLRGLARESVFAQILLGFELASTDSRFVGLNLVMPEDWYVPMRDFHLHMKMLDYLHGIYPKVHISLHAGELALGLVPPEGLSFHIRESVELGHAERIGHGVSIMNERDPLGLMREMVKRNVLVEICLTSENVILGVNGDQHPFPIYRRNNVPLTLATDDEGVLRSDLTHEYVRAAESYSLSYADLKRLARQSLEHSFLPGASLWTDTRQFHATTACEADRAHVARPSPGCQSFLAANERAKMQWKLEEEFAKFEEKY